MKYHFTTIRMATTKKTTKNKCWQGSEIKQTFVCSWWECKFVQPLCETVWRRILRKLKTDLQYDPTIPLLGIFLKKMKTLLQKDICTSMLIVTLFTIAKILRQHRCPYVDEWIKNMWYMHTMRQNGISLWQHGWT